MSISHDSDSFLSDSLLNPKTLLCVGLAGVGIACFCYFRGKSSPSTPPPPGPLATN